MSPDRSSLPNPGRLASPEVVPLSYYPACHAPSAHMHTSTSSCPGARERGSENPRTPAIHTQERNTHCTQNRRVKITNPVPQSAGDSKSGHRRISGLGAQLGERGCNETSAHTYTHSHTWDFTNPHRPHRLSPHSHTKCILPSSPLGSPHSLRESRGRGVRDPSGDSWKCHSPTPSVRHPHPLGCTLHTHTHSHTHTPLLP